MGRLGAGAGEADALGRRDQSADQLRPFELELVRRAVVRAAGKLRRDRIDDRRVIVAEDQGSVPADVIDVFVAVYVPHSGAGRARHEERVRLEIAGDVRDAVRKDPERAGVQAGRAARLLRVAAQDRGFRKRHLLAHARVGAGHGAASKVSARPAGGGQHEPHGPQDTSERFIPCILL